MFPGPHAGALQTSKVEIFWGFTNPRIGKAGQAREAWLNDGLRYNQDRLNDCANIIYKSARRPLRRTPAQSWG